MAAPNPYAMQAIGAPASEKPKAGNTGLTLYKVKQEAASQVSKAKDRAKELKDALDAQGQDDMVGFGLGVGVGMAVDSYRQSMKPDSYLRQNPRAAQVGVGVLTLGGAYLAHRNKMPLAGKVLLNTGAYMLGSMSHDTITPSATPGLPGTPGIKGSYDPFNVLVSGLAAETGLPVAVCGALAEDAIEGMDDPSVGAGPAANVLWALWQQAVKAGQAPAVPASNVVVQGLGYDLGEVSDPAALCRIEGVAERMARQQKRKARRQARRQKRSGAAPASQVNALQQQVADLKASLEAQQAAAPVTEYYSSGDELELE